MKTARGYLADVCPGAFYWEPTSLEEKYPLGACKVDGKVFHPTSITTVKLVRVLSEVLFLLQARILHHPKHTSRTGTQQRTAGV